MSLFAGCSSQKENTEDDGRISISMYMWDRSMFKELTPWLEQKFPDINFTFVQSFNTMDYYKDLLARGEEMPDIIMVPGRHTRILITRLQTTVTRKPKK